MKQKTEAQAEFNKRVLIILSIGFVLVLIFQVFLFLNQSDNQALQATIEAQQTLVAGLLPTITYTPSLTPTATITPSPTMTFTPAPTRTLTPTPSSPYRLYETDYFSLIYYVDWHPTENMIAFGHHDTSEIIIYDAIEGHEIRRQQGLSDNLRHVRWSPDGRFLAAGDFNGRILVWDIGTWEQVASLAMTNFVQTLTWSVDGRFIAASAARQARIWETESWSTVGDYDRGSFTTSIALAFNGNRFVSVAGESLLLAIIGEDGAISETRSIAQIPDQNRDFVFTSWSDDGRWILGGTNDGEIYVFTAETEQQEQLLTGHFGNIVDLRWSRNGRYLASAGEDETVHIWDTTSWTLLTSLNVLGREDIGSIAWSPDNCFIAVQTYDIEIWTLPELCEQE